MAHVAKYTKNQCGGLTRHYERAKNHQGEYLKFSNQEIDLERTKFNYNLAPRRSSQLKFIDKRTSEVKCLRRDDVKVMCSWVLTAPKDLPPDREREFFQAGYDFMAERYGGQKNVISAYVHMDETTPHMHFSFVPVIRDKKSGIEKVSAKEVLNRQDLRSFHTDLEAHMAKIFGREVGILNEATKAGNKAIIELKRGTAQAEHSQLIENIEAAKRLLREYLKKMELAENAKNEALSECSRMLSNAQEEEKGIRDRLTPLKTEFEARKAITEHIAKCSEENMYPDYVKFSRKGFLVKEELVTVPKEKWEERYLSSRELEGLVHAWKLLEKGIEDLKQSSLYEKIRDLEAQINELTEKVKIGNKDIARVNKVFRNNSEIANAFYSAEKALSQNTKQYKNKDDR